LGMFVLHAILFPAPSGGRPSSDHCGDPAVTFSVFFFFLGASTMIT
jgi:hypothetical protein